MQSLLAIVADRDSDESRSTTSAPYRFRGWRSRIRRPLIRPSRADDHDVVAVLRWIVKVRLHSCGLAPFKRDECEDGRGLGLPGDSVEFIDPAGLLALDRPDVGLADLGEPDRGKPGK